MWLGRPHNHGGRQKARLTWRWTRENENQMQRETPLTLNLMRLTTVRTVWGNHHHDSVISQQVEIIGAAIQDEI